MDHSCLGNLQSPVCNGRRTSHTSNAASRAARDRMTRGPSSTSARAALPCSRATISTAARAWRRESLAAREATMWRYRELMPLFDGEAAGDARRRLDAADPRARLGAALGLPRLFVKDESLNPTNSFKARGLVGGRHPGAQPRRDDAVGPVGRQRRQRDGRLRRARPGSRRRSSCRGTSRSRSSASASSTAPTSRSSTA